MSGKTHFGASTLPLNPGTGVLFVTEDSCGAVSVFVGITRKDTCNGKTVTALEFETHLPLLHAELEAIVQRGRVNFPDITNVYIEHRIGKVDIGEANIVIGVSSPHRKSAIHAVDSLMDDIKRTLPIWKKELFDDNTHVWKHNTENNW